MSGDKNFLKNRRRPRLTRHLSATYVCKGRQINGTVLNFSEIGFLILGDKLLEIGNIANYMVRLTPEITVALQGRVVAHHRLNTPWNEDPNPTGMGIEVLRGPQNFLDYVENIRLKVTKEEK